MVRLWPKPFSLQLAEAKPLFADRPLANTPEMARYFDGMRAAQQEDEDVVELARGTTRSIRTRRNGCAT